MLFRNIIEKFGDIQAGTTFKTNHDRDFNLSLLAGDTSHSLENRKHLCQFISHSLDHAVFAQQVHSNHIAVVSLNEKGAGAFQPENAISECDSMITKDKNLVLCIQTADCLPVFILDPIDNIIAMVHAGWRGTEKKILFKTIQKMLNAFDSKPENLIISFGPGIHSCCYEVSADFQQYFSAEVLEKRHNKYYLDLIKENSLQAIETGVTEKNILTESSLCTCCHLDKFFSYRKEGDQSGRIVSFLALN